jgi:hypothetical protein
MKWLSALILALAATPAIAREAQGPLARRSLSAGGLERHLLHYAPPAAQGPVPLPIVLHRGGGNGENAAKMTGFTDLARKEVSGRLLGEGEPLRARPDADGGRGHREMEVHLPGRPQRDARPRGRPGSCLAGRREGQPARRRAKPEL